MSSTSSTLNSVLSALGGATGIDVTAEVNSILYADRAPERGWQAQQSTLANQTAAINQLESEASTLSNALSDLQSVNGPLSAVTATSSNSNLVTATAADGTPASNYSITVNNVATSGSWYSDPAETTSSTALPAGSFDITAGSTTTPITVGSGVNTLSDLATYINGASLGVTANVITDSSGARLALTSSVSGTAGDFSISNDSSVAFKRSSTGADASLTVDNVPITSASNTVTGAIPGVTLNLLGAAPATKDSNGNVITPATSVNLSLAPDSSAITNAVNSFVSAYNSLITDVNTAVGYNESTNTPGVLLSDSSAQGLQSALLAATNYSGGGTFPSLSSLGINTNSDGTLSVDTTTLTSAITTNSTAVASFFQGSAFNGFANSLTSSLNTYTDPSEGAFTVDLQSISNENSELTAETNQLEVYLSAQQVTLTAQYNAADIAIQQLPEQIKQIQALLNPNQNSSSN
jgi:flagellar hook-associated protein 2